MLAQIVVTDEADRLVALEAVSRETCKLMAISRIRSDLVRFLPRSRFLLPTTFDGKAIAGLKIGPKTFLAEGATFLDAYHELRRNVLGD